jgi:hypothetical protein
MGDRQKVESVEQMLKSMEIPEQVPKSILTAINQLYEMEQKLNKLHDPGTLQRNVNKMKDAFEEFGLAYEDPMGQAFKETRTDLDARISGSGTENLVVVEVIKPIIRYISTDGHGRFSVVVQKGIVVVEARKES